MGKNLNKDFVQACAFVPSDMYKEVMAASKVEMISFSSYMRRWFVEGFKRDFRGKKNASYK